MTDTDDLRVKVAHALEMQFGQFLENPYKPSTFYGQAADSLIHLMTTEGAEVRARAYYADWLTARLG